MSYARESEIAKKAMAYDLIQLLHADENKNRTFSPADVETLIKRYISAQTGNS